MSHATPNMPWSGTSNSASSSRYRWLSSGSRPPPPYSVGPPGHATPASNALARHAGRGEAGVVVGVVRPSPGRGRHPRPTRSRRTSRRAGGVGLQELRRPLHELLTNVLIHPADRRVAARDDGSRTAGAPRTVSKAGVDDAGSVRRRHPPRHGGVAPRLATAAAEAATPLTGVAHRSTRTPCSPTCCCRSSSATSNAAAAAAVAGGGWVHADVLAEDGTCSSCRRRRGAGRRGAGDAGPGVPAAGDAVPVGAAAWAPRPRRRRRPPDRPPGTSPCSTSRRCGPGRWRRPSWRRGAPR